MKVREFILRKLKKYMEKNNHFIVKFLLFMLAAVTAGCASSSSGKNEVTEVYTQSLTEDNSLYIRLAPFVKENMLNADFWLKNSKNPDKVLMSYEQIELWNSVINDSTLPDNDKFYIYRDLRNFGNTVSSGEICNLIISYNPGMPWYKKVQTKKGEAVHTLNDRDFKVFWTEMNLEPLVTWKSWINQRWIPIKVKDGYHPVRRAVTVRRSSLRLLPENSFYSDDKDYWYDDITQNSGILMNEPVLVLWESADKKWYFVQSGFCPGWIKAEDIAFCTESQFNRYFDYAGRCTSEGADFVTVTRERYKLSKSYAEGNFEIPELFMGTYLTLCDWSSLKDPLSVFKGRIPYASYLVEIPYRKTDGTLGIHLAAIPYGCCTRGLLPYTKKNVLNLAFSAAGQRYGWGGMSAERDCSEFLKDVFRCFGFCFGRNSRSQLSMPGKTVVFDGKSEAERKALLDTVECGTLMGFPGHVFMYLGKADGHYYALSALGSYYPDDIFDEKTDANSVNVNTLDVKRKNSKSWFEALSKAKLLADDGDLYTRQVYLDPSWEFADLSKINSGCAVLFRAKNNRRNITVALNAGHGTRGGSSVKTFSHPDKSPKITGGTNPEGAVESIAVSGGMTFVSGESEAAVNLTVANLVKEKLLADGFDVLMLRTSGDVQLDNVARTVLANNNAAVHVSIHFDSDSSKADKGCFYCSIPDGLLKLKNVKKHRNESERLGRCFIESVKECGLDVFKDGKFQVDLTQTSYSTIPTSDFELGNQHTKITPENMEKRARAVALAVKKFFEN
jgi:N-acetylmuramoyl-L-alanine amidase